MVEGGQSIRTVPYARQLALFDGAPVEMIWRSLVLGIQCWKMAVLLLAALFLQVQNSEHSV